MYFKYVKNNIQGTYFVGILTDDIDVASTMSAVWATEMSIQCVTFK